MGVTYLACFGGKGLFYLLVMQPSYANAEDRDYKVRPRYLFLSLYARQANFDTHVEHHFVLHICEVMRANVVTHGTELCIF